jgi:hypothetical protein
MLRPEIKSLTFDLLRRALVGAIVLTGIVAIAFVMTGGRPPREILVGASIGGALSTACWSLLGAMSQRET